MRVADAANTAAGAMRELGVNARNVAPTTNDAANAARCSRPRNRGLGGGAGVSVRDLFLCVLGVYL